MNYTYVAHTLSPISSALNRYAASFCVALKIDGVVLSEVQLADFIGASRSGELYPKVRELCLFIF